MCQVPGSSESEKDPVLWTPQAEGSGEVARAKSRGARGNQPNKSHPDWSPLGWGKGEAPACESECVHV